MLLVSMPIKNKERPSLLSHKEQLDGHQSTSNVL
jgi:hypothetical protein